MVSMDLTVKWNANVRMKANATLSQVCVIADLVGSE